MKRRRRRTGRAGRLIGLMAAGLVAGAVLVPGVAGATPALGAQSVPPAEVCALLGTVAGTAAGLQATVQAQAGQALPVDLAATIDGLAGQAGCGASTGGSSPVPPAEVCALLSTVADTAATVQGTVETQSGQPLPVSLSATVAQLAGQVGCPTAPSPTDSTPANPACGLLASVADAAGTVQAQVQSASGQTLPVDLAATIGEVSSAAGCGTGAAPAPGLPPEACGVLGTVAATAGTLEATVESTTGQALPIDLAATIQGIATQAGCAAPSPDTGTGPGSDPPSGSGEPAADPGSGTGGSAPSSAGRLPGGSNGGSDSGATVLGAQAVREGGMGREGTLARTGVEILPLQAAGTALGALGAALAGLARAARTRQHI